MTINCSGVSTTFQKSETDGDKSLYFKPGVGKQVYFDYNGHFIDPFEAGVGSYDGVPDWARAYWGYELVWSKRDGETRTDYSLDGLSSSIVADETYGGGDGVSYADHYVRRPTTARADWAPDDQWWTGAYFSTLSPLHYHVVDVAVSLANTAVAYATSGRPNGLPAGYSYVQFFEVRHKNEWRYKSNPNARVGDRNEIYWYIQEPSNGYISGYTITYADNTTYTVNADASTIGTLHVGSAVSSFRNPITKIQFAYAAGYRVRVKFTGRGTSSCTIAYTDTNNASHTVNGTEAILQGGETNVVVTIGATEPTRIYQAKVTTYRSYNGREYTNTDNLPGRFGGTSPYPGNCTGTSAGSSRYRQLVATINSIDRSYEFTVPLETLYNLTVQNDTGWYCKTKKEQYYAWANSSAGTSGGWYFFPQNRNSETRTRVAAPGDDLVFSAKTGDNDSIIYQILDASGGVLLTNTAKAAEVSVPLIMPAGNLTVRILARLKTCKVEQFWWGPWAEYPSPSQALISAKYPGIESSTIHGAGDADYGDRVEIYPQPAQGFLSFGMCEYEYDPTVADDALHTLQVDRNRLRSPDVTQAAPYVIGAIEVPVGVIFFYGTANLQIVLATVGGGSVSGGGAFRQGAAKTGASPFTLTATPDAYYRFDHWEYKLTKRYTYDAQAAGTWGGVGPTVYPVVGREIVDDTVAGQQATLTLDPTAILDGVVEITAVFVLANPGQLLYGANGRLLFGSAGALLYQG